MSLAITHYALGVTGTTILLLLARQHAHRHAGSIALLGGFWGMIPDVWRFVPGLTRAHHQSTWANFFFGHQYMDTSIDPHDEHIIGVYALGLLLLSTLALTIARQRDDT